MFVSKVSELVTNVDTGKTADRHEEPKTCRNKITSTQKNLPFCLREPVNPVLLTSITLLDSSGLQEGACLDFL